MDVHVAKELLDRAHTPETATAIFTEKVKQKPLVLRPTSPDPAENARSKRQHQRLVKERAQRRSNKPKPLSAKRKRALGLNETPKEQRRYSIYEPLHTLWCDYIQSILGIKDNPTRLLEAQSLGPLLASADYHGALLEVVRSRCVSRVGLKGIVIKDTKFTFELITIENELKSIPKEYTTFRFTIPGANEHSAPYVLEILGSQFETRAADRATKKFRLHMDLDT